MPTLFGVEVSDHVYEANCHLLQAEKQPKTQARKDIDAELKQQFARNFEAMWQLSNGPTLKKEFYFCPNRDWRSDYLVVGTEWLIELDGGVWTKGRHVRPKGFIEDVYKYNMATMLGYRVIRIATGMVNPNYLQDIIDVITQQSPRSVAREWQRSQGEQSTTTTGQG